MAQSKKANNSSPYISISFHPKPRASGIVGSSAHKRPFKVHLTSPGLNELAPHKAPMKGGVLQRGALKMVSGLKEDVVP